MAHENKYHASYNITEFIKLFENCAAIFNCSFPSSFMKIIQNEKEVYTLVMTDSSHRRLSVSYENQTYLIARHFALNGKFACMHSPTHIVTTADAEYPGSWAHLTRRYILVGITMLMPETKYG